MPNLKAYCDRSSDCPEGPYTLFIEPTNHCNLRCIFCPQKKQTRPKGYMGCGDFEKILAEAVRSSVKKINLFFLGESLLHPEVFWMIRRIKQAGIHCRLNTNATLLNEVRCQNLLDSGLDHLTISFDGATPELYEKLRCRGAYEETRARISALLEARETHHCDMFVEIEMIVVPETKPYFWKFEQEMKEYKPDRIQQKPFRNWTGDICSQGAEPKERKASIDSGVHVCSYPWRSMAVLWDGRVVPCCVDWDARYPLGNFQEGLLELWNGERMRCLRENLISSLSGEWQNPECARLCAKCDIRRQVEEHPDCGDPEIVGERI